eukprot:5453425-Prymnesium_polylepis.1
MERWRVWERRRARTTKAVRAVPYSTLYSSPHGACRGTQRCSAWCRFRWGLAAAQGGLNLTISVDFA